MTTTAPLLPVAAAEAEALAALAVADAAARAALRAAWRDAAIARWAAAIWATATAVGDRWVVRQSSDTAWRAVSLDTGWRRHVQAAARAAGETDDIVVRYIGAAADTGGYVHPALVPLLEELDQLLREEEEEAEAEYRRAPSGPPY